MDVVKGEYFQLTRSSGNNEHPVWSPDSRHLAFESNRTGTKQIYIMLADGDTAEGGHQQRAKHESKLVAFS